MKKVAHRVDENLIEIMSISEGFQAIQVLSVPCLSTSMPLLVILTNPSFDIRFRAKPGGRFVPHSRNGSLQKHECILELAFQQVD